MSVSSRIYSLLVAALISSGLLVATMLYLSNERADRAQNATVEQLLDLSISILERYKALSDSGKTDESSARKLAYDTITALRFSGQDSIYIIDKNGMVVAHVNPRFQGIDSSTMTDSKGYAWGKVLAELARNFKPGTFDYAVKPDGVTELHKSGMIKPYLPWGVNVATGVTVNTLDAEKQQAIRNALIAGGVLILATGGFAFFIARSITAPMARIRAAMEAIAGGVVPDVSRDAARRDEFGAIARAVNVFEETKVARERAEQDASTQAGVMRQKQEEHVRERLEEAARTQTMVEAIAVALERLAKGDLTTRITAEFPGPYAALKGDFNETASQLEKTVSTIRSTARNLRSGTDEISQAADDLSRRTEQQAASLEQTAAALDEITTTVRKTADGANHARDLVSSVSHEASGSSAIVREAVQAMGEIEKSSGQVGEIIGVIDEIAFQTNLLALNAGVEAARAGEAGKGFAVVATEVRALAQRSAEAAKEIRQLIGSSTSQVERGVDLVSKAGAALVNIAERIDAINATTAEIAASAIAQATGLGEVNTALNQMDQVTQQNAAMVEESTAASHAIADESRTLYDLVSRFTVGSADPAGIDTPVAARPDRTERQSARTGSAGRVARRPVVSRGSLAVARAVDVAEDEWQEF